MSNQRVKENQKKKLVIDIETIGINFESLDEKSQEYFLKYAENKEEEKETKEKMGLYPLTGEIVAIGILNPDTDKGIIYLKNSKSDLQKNNKIEKEIKIEFGSEKKILENFWKTIESYNYFISFNGRGFDIPFLMIRSAILGVKPTKNLLSNRYLNSQNYDAIHIDLLDQLTFYGAFRKKFSLHLWCKAFGIKSPKEEGIAGDDVSLLYKEGKILEIAEYNARDLKATKELYEKWNNYLNF
ncbi:ribonuclease H-like domain-containing protein [Candidatus Wolfebacteria bacterium]|nr:ribonuclease H-like domain-containing protein [Candidatus Wolfebacteria bacterium]